MLRRLFLMLLLLSAQLCNGYERPSAISEQEWNELSPYFLPDNHPAKQQLDKIFRKRTVTQSTKTVLDAGFFNANIGKYTKVIVSGHWDLPGYVVKMYLDSKLRVNEGQKFKERILGANAVRACIKAHNLERIVKTPQKWIYPIPEFADSGPAPKHFVLIAEDMLPINSKKSLDKWKNNIKKKHLDAVWTVIETVGLPDCVYAFNLPFCTDGRIAFLDTEYCGLWPVPYKNMEKYLKGKMLDYWNQITRH